MQGVYAIKNTKDGRVYIGSSQNIDSRFSTHKSEFRSGKHQNARLLNAYKSIGSEGFKYVVLEEVKDKADLKVREDFWITHHDAINEAKGFNLARPVGGYKITWDNDPDFERIRKPTKTGPPLRGEGVVSPLAELFREKIRLSGKSVADIARESGIDYSVIFRFVKGDRDLNSGSYHQLMTLFRGKIVFEGEG